jgi:hypothetical protein
MEQAIVGEIIGTAEAFFGFAQCFFEEHMLKLCLV